MMPSFKTMWRTYVEKANTKAVAKGNKAKPKKWFNMTNDFILHLWLLLEYISKAAKMYLAIILNLNEGILPLFWAAWFT